MHADAFSLKIPAHLEVPYPRAYWVIPGLLLAGEYPAEKNPAEAKQKLEKLLDTGVRQIVNLMETQETDHTGQRFTRYENLFAELGQERNIRVGVRRFPVTDRRFPGPDKMKEILDFIDQHIKDWIPVYVHCWGGIGRTGTRKTEIRSLDRLLAAHPDFFIA